MRRIVTLVVSLVLVLLPLGASTAAPAPQPGAPMASFTIAAPRSVVPSGLVARAVVTAGIACPSVRVVTAEGVASLPMAERARPERTGPAFTAVTVCSADLPVGARSASIAGVGIPAAMPERVERMAILADTGCRIKGHYVQNCSDDREWPIARIAAQVAADRPDVIVMPGDYFYRYSPCPAENQDWCGSSPPPVTGMPFSASAYGWIVDVLLPMSPMFAAAPLVAARGNHEACNRGGNGFFYFFDPRPNTSSTCAPVRVGDALTVAPTVPSPTYPIDLPIAPDRTLRIAVLDSAGGEDFEVTSYAPVQRESFVQAARLTKAAPGRESWLMSHRPIYGFTSTEFAEPGQPYSPWTSYDQAAAAWGLLGTYDLVLTAHIHLAQAIRLPGLPAQLLIGNGGTALDPELGYPLPTEPYVVGPGRAYPAPEWAWVAVRFGYAMATPGAAAGAWKIDLRDTEGRSFARCGVNDRQIYCRDRSR